MTEKKKVLLHGHLGTSGSGPGVGSTTCGRTSSCSGSHRTSLYNHQKVHLHEGFIVSDDFDESRQCHLKASMHSHPSCIQPLPLNYDSKGDVKYNATARFKKLLWIIEAVTEKML